MDPVWVNAVANLSAVGILGYHLLWGLPRILDAAAASWKSILSDVLTDQKSERQIADQRADRLTDAVDRLAQGIGASCRFKG